MGSAAGRGQLEEDRRPLEHPRLRPRGGGVGALRHDRRRPPSFWEDVWDQWRDYYPELLRGYRNTIILSLVSFALAMALGAIVALTRTSDFLVLRFVSGAYIRVVPPNTPLLIQLFFWFFGLPRLELPAHRAAGLVPPVAVGGVDRRAHALHRAGLHRRGAAQRPALDRQGPDGGRALRGAELCPDARLRGCPPERFAWRSRCSRDIFSALFRNSLRSVPPSAWSSCCAPP